MVNNSEVGVKNQYTRAVSPEGNRLAHDIIQETMELRPSFEWRGLGTIADSALAIAEDYHAFDAEKLFNIPVLPGEDHKQCACPEILRGIKKPKDCKLFAKACTPEQPVGACMVSSEGSCAAMYHYGEH